MLKCVTVLMFLLATPLLANIGVVNNESDSLQVVKTQEGIASWYGGYHNGRKTASGEVYREHLMTCASNSHKFGTKLRVTNPKTGKSVIVKVNDTGGFSKYGRLLDLSKGAFEKIANLKQGLVRVIVEVLE